MGKHGEGTQIHRDLNEDNVEVCSWGGLATFSREAALGGIRSVDGHSERMALCGALSPEDLETAAPHHEGTLGPCKTSKQVKYHQIPLKVLKGHFG